MSRIAARPDRTIRLWQRAFSRGYAGVLCDALVAQRDVPAALYAVLRLPPLPLSEGDLRRLPPPGPVEVPDRPATPVPLSLRQTKILGLAALGLSDEAIASRLSCSRHTVVRHWRSIFDRMDLHGQHAPRTRAVARGIRSGMI